ncbi:MAG: valine--tRNA ligase [Anaerolineales bacterium]
MPTIDLPKTYDFHAVERKLYEWWEKNGYFQPAIDHAREPFVISIPPPNVTGELHLGHAMFVSIEDLMIRYHRMLGEPTLWVPGSDHAGIATQLQVEKMLLREDEVTREELGREKFVERTWEWKHKYGGIIYDQLRRLGASCDWRRERFTLDEGLARAVREAFVRLHEKGLLYRGPRLVNWSPGLRTAVSDLEVEYSDEPGALYYFKYMIKDADGDRRGDPADRPYIPVATTRPETILGDTAVAVHPEDPRYAALVGRTAIVPILGREIPVIADEAVDREFGTGALKITPGHDPVDYEVGQRHKLPIISIFDKNACLNENGGPYAGMDRFDCRKKMWADMRAEGLVIKEEPYPMRVPRSQRGGEIVEPMISTQWFINIKPLADAALQAVREGRIKIIPEHFTKVYYNWLENIQDWCISRQLWWGHRIPVWYCEDGHLTVTREDPTKCAECGSKKLKQDEDVLDTWFSSGLWPFSTLGWPEETRDLKYFYPTTVMETGYDILFFWVARMIMFALEFTGDVPFRTVYLHGLVRDEKGRKMSKSIGNVMDPRWVMDGATAEQIRAAGTSAEIAEQFPEGIPGMGTDALRFTLITSGTPGNDLNLSMERVEANRNFANKLWNAGRYTLGAFAKLGEGCEKAPRTLADRWILSRLSQTVQTATGLMDKYQFGEAGRTVYDFFWGEFADWYIELSKLQIAESPARARSTAQILAHVLDSCLRLLHPFTPFVTEALWGYLKDACREAGEDFDPPGGWPEALIIAPWPQPVDAVDGKSLEEFSLFADIVRSIRNLRAEKKVPLSKKTSAVIMPDKYKKMLSDSAAGLCLLARLDPKGLTFSAKPPAKAKGMVPLVVGPVRILIPLAEMADAGAERKRLKKEFEQTESQIHRVETLLAGDFGTRAPAAIVEKERARLAALKETRGKLEEQLKALGK